MTGSRNRRRNGAGTVTSPARIRAGAFPGVWQKLYLCTSSRTFSGKGYPTKNQHKDKPPLENCGRIPETDLQTRKQKPHTMKPTHIVKDQKVRTAFFKLGDTKIELLESTDPEGPIGKFVEKRGEGIHHVAFAVEDTQAALDDAAAKGVQLIDKAPRKGAEGLNIGFLHPKSTHGVLTEFCCKDK